MDKRNAGFEHGAAPMKASGSSSGRITARLLALFQALDVLTEVAAFSGPARHRLGSHLAPAGVGVQRGTCNAESVCSLLCGQVNVDRAITLIHESILTIQHSVSKMET